MTAGKHTVLIVDDEVDMRLLVRTVLVTSDLPIEVVDEAMDGTEAMRALSALHPPYVPDVVILDSRLAGKDGLDVAVEMLKVEPRQHIVLFCAFVTPDIEARALAVGVRACVAKNDFARLPELVAQLSSSSSSTAVASR